jgi:STAM-binding protein
MRTVVIPHQAIDAFMFAARANTARNIETCAILGGIQAGDSLVISTVIVPQQKGNRLDHVSVQFI